MSEDREDRAIADRLWKSHVETGEPLGEEEVAIVVAAGLAEESDWEDRGGGLFWHAPTWPDPDAAE